MLNVQIAEPVVERVRVEVVDVVDLDYSAVHARIDQIDRGLQADVALHVLENDIHFRFRQLDDQRAVVDAIRRPRREVLVTNPGGKLLRFFGLFPGLLARGMDGAERRGRSALED